METIKRIAESDVSVWFAVLACFVLFMLFCLLLACVFAMSLDNDGFNLGLDEGYKEGFEEGVKSAHEAASAGLVTCDRCINRGTDGCPMYHNRKDHARNDGWCDRGER